MKDVRETRAFLKELQGLCFKYNVSVRVAGGTIDGGKIEVLEAYPDGCKVEATDPDAIGQDRKKRLRVGVGKFGS